MGNKADTRPCVVIAGACATGCYVGGLLAHAGLPASLFGCIRILDALRANGLRLTDYTGLDVNLTSDVLDLHE